MFPVRGFATHAATAPLVPFRFDRRDPGPHDVQIEILYCGVCHSDLHQARNEWSNALYPMVPGHEIVGRVVAVGADVTKFKAGDLAGVGCMVDSCRTCAAVRGGLEQYCAEAAPCTYNGHETRLRAADLRRLFGADRRRTKRFVLRIPEGMDLRPSRRCCAPASPPIRRCATGRSDPARRSASSAWAASATWG